MKIQIYFLLLCSLYQSLIAQQTEATLPKVENHLKGDLDYTHEVLELVQKQINGKDMRVGQIYTDGTIHFNLPEFNIKRLYDSINLQHPKFQQLFEINSDCKDLDPFVKTPFDEVYSQKYNPIYVKKYNTYIAALYPVSDTIIVSRNNNNRTLLPSEATYFWFYIDRAIAYKDDCTKISYHTGDAYTKISANVQFEKGWNFIEENLVEIPTIAQIDSTSTGVRKTEFKKASPFSKKVKWIIKQIQEDVKIQIAKKLYNVTPLSKEQFEKWAPNKLGNLSIITKEHGIPPRGNKNLNNLHLIYVDKKQEKKIDLYVVDCAKNPEDMEMINFAYAMENDGKDQKDTKPYVAKYNEGAKTAQLLYKVEDRLFVNASGMHINAQELWGYIQKLEVLKLIKK